jgi:hypothetical protein
VFQVGGNFYARAHFVVPGFRFTAIG